MSNTAPVAPEPYVKKTVALPLISGPSLELAVSQTLFSSHQVDIGTMHLLKTLQDPHLDHAAAFFREGRSFLDLGCGYGPIGVALAHLNPAASGHLVDRDALAVTFARHNAVRNALPKLKVYGSLGYDDVTVRDFDLIVSNIPGKAGETVIRSLLLDAVGYLSPTGFVAIVVVLPLESLVQEILSAPEVEILFHQTTSAHAVFHYRFIAPREIPDDSGFERGLYDREELAFILDDHTVPMLTVRGLGEFDTLSYETALLLKALRELDLDKVARANVFNPGQGHVPVALWRLFAPQAFDLVDRDLLSLRISQLNLGSNGCDQGAIGLHHQVPLTPPDARPDLVVGVLREDEGPEAIEAGLVHAAEMLPAGGVVLIAGTSTPVTRVLKSQSIGRLLRDVKRKRQKGCSTVHFRRR